MYKTQRFLNIIILLFYTLLFKLSINYEVLYIIYQKLFCLQTDGRFTERVPENFKRKIQKINSDTSTIVNDKTEILEQVDNHNYLALVNFFFFNNIGFERTFVGIITVDFQEW